MNEAKTTALFEAIRENESLGKIKKLVISGADVNGKDFLNQTPLIVALERSTPGGGPPLVAFLLEFGADPTTLGAGNKSTLTAAVKSGQMKSLLMILDQLQNRGALTGDWLNAALSTAIKITSSKQIVSTLLDYGADAKTVERMSFETGGKGVKGVIDNALLKQSDNPAEQTVGWNNTRPRDRGIQR